MSEKLLEDVVTKNDLIFGLKEAGIKPNDCAMVHTAMKGFGCLLGGSETIVVALEESIPQGTIMMPSEVSLNCDPANWAYPPVASKKLIQYIRDNMPPYNTETSMTEGLGLTPEYFRVQKDVVRSTHPYLPIAIWGKNKDVIAKSQPLDMPYGKDSPLDYLYQHDGKIIFLNTDYETCTMMHYAESIINRKVEKCSAATSRDKNGKTIWTDYWNIDMDSYDDFEEIGRNFERKFPQDFNEIKVGGGFIKVIEASSLVDFAKNIFLQKDIENGNHQYK